MPKKALIIAYYWPPAGGPGVQRWLKFVKYLRDYDVEPVVYVPENPNYPMIDEGLAAEIPEGTTILKRPISEPYKWAQLFSKGKTKSISKGIIETPKEQTFIEKLLLFVRGNFFIPDARKNWVNPSIAYLNDYCKEASIDTVITTGPPHSMHLIGLGLKKRLGMHWIADFRDPWTTIGYHKKLLLTPRAAKKHKTLEQQVLNAADQLIVTSYTTKKEFESLTETSIEVITNGYDYENVPPVSLDTQFTLSHIGSLLTDRDPKVLWKVLSALVDENQAFAKAFKLRLVGAVSTDVIKSIKAHDLGAYLECTGYVSHQEALRYQRRSQVVLLIEIDSEDTRCIVPGKLFEYMVSNRPIIAVGPKEADIETLIKTTNTGVYANYEDEKLLKDTILKYFEAFQAGALKSHPIGLQQFSRQQLTKKLANLILNN